MAKILTISIPTWNRASLLENLLSEITNQIQLYKLEDKIELLISNNNSSDNTDELVKSFQQKFDFITYNKNTENIGGKSNVLKSMELASSKYVMFIGDDDKIRNDSLPELINFLEHNADTGILIDVSKLKKNKIYSDSQISLKDLLEKLYWYIGNAGFFVVKSSYVRDNLSNYGYNFLNESWPQTQLMILGAYKNKSFKNYLKNFKLTSESFHGEVMSYSSYYLWRTCYYDLHIAIESIKSEVDPGTVNAAKKYLSDNIVQFFYNVLQCGVFLDDNDIKQKTVRNISERLHLFSEKEKFYFRIINIALSISPPLAKFISNIFIFSIRGMKGIKKKNEFVKNEMLKKSKIKNEDNLAVRGFPL